MMLKNRMVRHESRSPSPKIAGPSVPAENLAITPSKLHYRRQRTTHVRIFTFNENQRKKILLNWVSVRSSTSTG